MTDQTNSREGGFSGLRNSARLLSYVTAALAGSGSVRTTLRSLRSGIRHSSELIYADRDPVFAFVDWERMGLELRTRTVLPVASLERSTTLREKMCLAALLQIQKPDVVFEFGTYRGATTQLIHENTHDACRIVSFDIPPQIDAHTEIDRTALVDLAALGLHDTMQRDFFPASPRAEQKYADLTAVDWSHIRALPAPDFFFIDADHSYAGCHRDSRNAIDWVGDDAMIVWHDASWRNYAYVENDYGVHASIVDVTSEEARGFTWRMKGTSLIVRSKPHKALFDRFLMDDG